MFVKKKQHRGNKYVTTHTYVITHNPSGMTKLNLTRLKMLPDISFAPYSVPFLIREKKVKTL